MLCVIGDREKKKTTNRSDVIAKNQRLKYKENMKDLLRL